MEKNFAQFVHDLEAPETLKAWGPALALLAGGSFGGLVAFGRKKGYTFTAADVKGFLHTRQGGGVGAHAPGVAARTPPAGRPNNYLLAWARG